MGQLAMHLRSGRVFEITHALNVLSVLSNDMVLEIGRVADLPVVLYQLWEQELAALPRLRPNAVEGAADIFGYDGYFYRTWDDLYALHNHASRDPTSCKVRATQRLLAITGIFRNLSFHEPNQKHFGGNAVFVGLLLDTISAQLDERGESSGSKDPHSSGDFEQLVVLELHKNVVTIVSNMGAHVKFDTPFAAGRILRFLFGFLSADPRNAALGPYMFPALEAFVRICVPYENREILGWNADLLALDAWIGKLCEYLQSAVDDFALSIPQMATLELVLMALFNLSSLSEDLRQSVSLYAGCLHSLVTITLAKPPAAANPELGLVWTTVRAKAAQVLRELARCEASHSHLRIFETNLITQLMDIAVGRMPHHSMGIPPQLAMTVELVTALHGVLYSLQIGPE